MTRVASLFLALLLALTATACSDDADEPSSDPGTSSEAPDSGDDADSDDGADAEPATPPVFTDGPGDVTLTFSGGAEQLGEGSFDQSEVTIAVGQVVEFRSGDDGTYSVEVGGLDGVTISGGLTEYYRFDAAGSYPVEEDLSGATATVIVQ